MDLVCYLHPGWAPLIRPAPVKREWMDNTPDSFAYRCLPLNIANAHGWEILCPCAFDALWNGEAGTGAVTIYPDPSSTPEQRPVLEPGDIIFMPLGWWHQVRSLDFSVTVTYTNFLWRNDYF